MKIRHPVMTEHEALVRANKLINTMADYVGRMAVPAEFFADLNEHWCYCEVTMTKEQNKAKHR